MFDDEMHINKHNFNMKVNAILKDTEITSEQYHELVTHWHMKVDRAYQEIEAVNLRVRKQIKDDTKHFIETSEQSWGEDSTHTVDWENLKSDIETEEMGETVNGY